jgi:hypothetical protein
MAAVHDRLKEYGLIVESLLRLKRGRRSRLIRFDFGEIDTRELYGSDDYLLWRIKKNGCK